MKETGNDFELINENRPAPTEHRTASQFRDTLILSVYNRFVKGNSQAF